jgi:hypothetical protein
MHIAAAVPIIIGGIDIRSAAARAHPAAAPCAGLFAPALYNYPLLLVGAQLG